MGPSYELQEWLGKYYIVYRDDSSNWLDAVHEISELEYLELEAQDAAHQTAVEKLLVDILRR